MKTVEAHVGEREAELEHWGARRDGLVPVPLDVVPGCSLCRRIVMEACGDRLAEVAWFQLVPNGWLCSLHQVDSTSLDRSSTWKQ
jgi:hypothetical protein